MNETARCCSVGTPPTENARNLLKRLGLRLKKGWGQHFLTDSSVLDDIVSAADLSRDDTIIEVGPGLGVLTEALLQRAGKVISIEVDPALARALSKAFAGAQNLKIVNADALKVDLESLLREEAGSQNQKYKYKVVANIPYYITGPILRHFLESKTKPRLLVLMVQREVAENIVAEPGHMSILSIAVQFYGKPNIVRYVPPSSFYPEPDVDSALVKIEVYGKPAVDVDNVDDFFALVRAGFSAPRKQLRNTLAQGLGTTPPQAIMLLKEAGLDPARRPQTLAIQDWARLYRKAKENRDVRFPGSR